MNQKNVNFDKLQILLINDGSNYDLQPMVQSFSQLHIEYHKKNNANWGSVINYCKNNKLIKGKYVTIIDSDDIYWPNRLHFLTDALENGQEDMVVANLYR
jgi:glycosyltransferase involved in cell wall biosynthesis